MSGIGCPVPTEEDTRDTRAAFGLPERLDREVPEYNAAIATIVNCRHVAEWVTGCCAPCARAAVDSIARAAIRTALDEAAPRRVYVVTSGELSEGATIGGVYLSRTAARARALQLVTQDIETSPGTWTSTATCVTIETHEIDDRVAAIEALK